MVGSSMFADEDMDCTMAVGFFISNINFFTSIFFQDLLKKIKCDNYLNFIRYFGVCTEDKQKKI